jgi:hypothetical protein
LTGTSNTSRRRRVLWAVAAATALLITVVVAVTLTQNAGETQPAPAPSDATAPEETPSPTPDEQPNAAQSEGCPAATVEVASAAQLQDALDGAGPGTIIRLDGGTYTGEFSATASGDEDNPIMLCGTRESILDGGAIDGGYVLHLDGVSHWVLDGFSVKNGQKGVMADRTTNSIIRGLTVSEIGDEAIHLRAFSTDNIVAGNTISNTGLRREKFGEGIYIGTAESNWCDISRCEPDASDRNRILGNIISGTTSESVDIKEGTRDGVLSDNRFDGASIVGADSWVDVKGNGWLIENNTGQNSPLDGFQTHEILDGWGTDNIFRGNTATVNGPGVGFSLTPVRDNVVECSNTVSGAGEGFATTDCEG